VARLHPIWRTSPEDVFVVGYPKSGNTWFQHLVAGAVFGVDVGLAPAGLVPMLVPDVDRRQFYRRYGPVAFFKSHHLPRPEYRKVVYLLRDGRDAMVSYRHHLEALRGNGSIDFLRIVETGEGLFPCRWHDHVEAWERNPLGAEKLVIRYEDLKGDPVGELRRFCEFAGVGASDERLRTAVDNASFERMRDHEAEVAVHANPKWPADRPFFRRGEVGSFREEMPPDVLAAFLRQAGGTLRAAGYADVEAEA